MAAHRRLLLVDFEPQNIKIMTEMLTSAGYQVDVAQDGLAALEAFRANTPDGVVLEAMIPKKHGFEVCQEIKKDPLRGRVPVLITTGIYRGRKYRNQALHVYKCDEYLERPFNRETLLTALARVLPHDELPEEARQHVAKTASPDLASTMVMQAPPTPAVPTIDEGPTEQVPAESVTTAPGAPSAPQLNGFADALDEKLDSIFGDDEPAEPQAAGAPSEPLEQPVPASPPEVELEDDEHLSALGDDEEQAKLAPPPEDAVAEPKSPIALDLQAANARVTGDAADDIGSASCEKIDEDLDRAFAELTASATPEADEPPPPPARTIEDQVFEGSADDEAPTKRAEESEVLSLFDAETAAADLPLEAPEGDAALTEDVEDVHHALSMGEWDADADDGEALDEVEAIDEPEAHEDELEAEAIDEAETHEDELETEAIAETENHDELEAEAIDEAETHDDELEAEAIDETESHDGELEAKAIDEAENHNGELEAEAVEGADLQDEEPEAEAIDEAETQGESLQSETFDEIDDDETLHAAYDSVEEIPDEVINDAGDEAAIVAESALEQDLASLEDMSAAEAPSTVEEAVEDTVLEPEPADEAEETDEVDEAAPDIAVVEDLRAPATEPSRSRSWLGIGIAAAVALVVVGAGGLWLLTGRSGESSRATQAASLAAPPALTAPMPEPIASAPIETPSDATEAVADEPVEAEARRPAPVATRPEPADEPPAPETPAVTTPPVVEVAEAIEPEPDPIDEPATPPEPETLVATTTDAPTEATDAPPALDEQPLEVAVVEDEPSFTAGTELVSPTNPLLSESSDGERAVPSWLSGEAVSRIVPPAPEPAPPEPAELIAPPEPSIAVGTLMAMSEVDELPRAIETRKPDYPRIAQMRRLEGRVIVNVLIDPDGAVEDAKVVTSAGNVLDQAALSAVRAWRYTPARKEGVAVRTWKTEVLVFKQ